MDRDTIIPRRERLAFIRRVFTCSMDQVKENWVLLALANFLCPPGSVKFGQGELIIRYTVEVAKARSHYSQPNGQAQQGAGDGIPD